MRVVGTAGHVDHGKSALVKALTGINPDRLREEQERQMTIDLGFAWLTLPSGEEMGIVDVPGHRDFIENMLAGVGGIDAAVFVIATDEGVMPQTREHLAILNLLDIDRGVVVLSKIDLIADPDWLILVREEVRSLLKGTALQDAAIIPVSAHTGQGLDVLIEQIEQVLSDSPTRNDIRRPRLSIDRAFTISGFGTVVTGTLVDGHLEIGDEIEILPNGLRGRIRGLQTHKSKIEAAVPGSRVAVNITGVDVAQIQRGDVLMHPGTASSTSRVDVHFSLLESSALPVKHNQEVKLFVGAAQRLARVRLLGASSLQPGQEGWLQLELDSPIVVARDDRYILRRPSPPATIGGGIVVDPHPERRHRRKDHNVIERLEKLLVGDPEDVLLQTLRRSGPIERKNLLERVGLQEPDFSQALQSALKSGLVVNIGSDAGDKVIYADKETWDRVVERIQSELSSFHAEHPLRQGMNVEELRSKLELGSRSADAVFTQAEEKGVIVVDGQMVRSEGFKPELTGEQERAAQDLLKRFRETPFSPPSIKESIAMIGEDVYHHLINTHKLKPVSEDVVYLSEMYEKMVAEIVSLLEDNETITVAQVRDHFDTSRKYVLALLEHLDATGLTVREEDHRRLA